MSNIIYFLSLYLFAAVIGVQGGILNIKNINIAVDVKEAEWRYFIINVAFADRPLAFQCYNAVLEGAQQIEVSSSDMPLKRAAKWRTSMAMASFCSDAIIVSSLTVYFLTKIVRDANQSLTMLTQAICRTTKQEGEFKDDELELRLENLPKATIRDSDDADISGVVPMTFRYFNSRSVRLVLCPVNIQQKTFFFHFLRSTAKL